MTILRLHVQKLIKIDNFQFSVIMHVKFSFFHFRNSKSTLEPSFREILISTVSKIDKKILSIELDNL